MPAGLPQCCPEYNRRHPGLPVKRSFSGTWASVGGRQVRFAPRQFGLWDLTYGMILLVVRERPHDQFIRRSHAIAVRGHLFSARSDSLFVLMPAWERRPNRVGGCSRLDGRQTGAAEEVCRGDQPWVVAQDSPGCTKRLHRVSAIEGRRTRAGLKIAASSSFGTKIAGLGVSLGLVAADYGVPVVYSREPFGSR